MKIDYAEVIKTLNKTIESYERMLREVIVEKGERFDSAPYTHSIQTLLKMLEITQNQEDGE